MATGHVLRAESVAALATVPEHLRDGLRLYVERRIPPGSFLQAVLASDLFDAYARGDENSIAGLQAIVRWIYNHTPGGCWGDRARVRKWLYPDTEPTT